MIKKYLRSILFLIFGGGVALAAPIVPTDMQWLVSYETVQFETADGDLSEDQYFTIGTTTVPNHDGTETEKTLYAIRTQPKNVAGITSTTSPEAIKGKTEVSIRCEECAYYSEFINRKGEKVRVPENQQKYRNLKLVKNAEKPSRSENISVLSGLEAEAAITYDATSNSGSQTLTSSYSWSHTVTTGSNLFLWVGVGLTGATASDYNVTGITYNSDALTEAVTQTAYGGRASGWYMVAPDTGSNTVVVSLGGSSNAGAAGAVSFTGVDQSSTIIDTDGTNTVASSVSLTLTTVSDNEWVLDSGFFGDSENDGSTPVNSDGQTEEYVVDHPAYAAHTFGGSIDAGTAGNITVGWECSVAGCGFNDDVWVYVAASINPASGAASNTTPTITSFSDSPDPQTVGSDITFSVDWNDADGEGVSTYVCDTSATSTSGCGSTTFASHTATSTATDPQEVTYTAQQADIASSPITYYIFVCDDEGDDSACSTATSSTFSVIAVPDPRIQVDNGGIIINNGGIMVDS